MSIALWPLPVLATLDGQDWLWSSLPEGMGAAFLGSADFCKGSHLHRVGVKAVMLEKVWDCETIKGGNCTRARDWNKLKRSERSRKKL